MAQYAFLVVVSSSSIKGQKYESPVFVMFMSKNLSTNLPPPMEGKCKLPR